MTSRRRIIAAGAVVILGLGFGLLRWRKHSIEAEAADARARDAELEKFYRAIVVGAMESHASDKLPDVAPITGKLLPINSIGLEQWVYPRLDESLRTSHTEDAGTLAVVEVLSTTIYAENHMMTGGVASAVTVTLFDLRYRAPISRKHFSTAPPPQTATRDELQAYSERLWLEVAGYLNGLPRR